MKHLFLKNFHIQYQFFLINKSSFYVQLLFHNLEIQRKLRYPQTLYKCCYSDKGSREAYYFLGLSTLKKLL